MNAVIQALTNAKRAGKLDGFSELDLESLIFSVLQQIEISSVGCMVGLVASIESVLDRVTKGAFANDPARLKAALAASIAMDSEEVSRRFTAHIAAANARPKVTPDMLAKRSGKFGGIMGKVKRALDNMREITRGLTQKSKGNTAGQLEKEPAWELVRVASRMVPRGSPDSDSPGWRKRWKFCGGPPMIGERMIAMKSDPIWEALGDPFFFPDAVGTDWPPLAWNSGMGWIGISREECVTLGLIGGASLPKRKVVPLTVKQLAREVLSSKGSNSQEAISNRALLLMHVLS